MATALPAALIFNGEDYNIWSIKMKTLLQSQNLWSLVENGFLESENEDELSDEEKEKLNENRILDAKALVFLQQGVSNQIFQRIRFVTKAKEAWEILQVGFQGYKVHGLRCIENEEIYPTLNSKIQRVPFMLGDNNNLKKYYEPKVVSIGPIHHGNPKLKLSDNIKNGLAVQFIKAHGLEKENLCKEIMEAMDYLKNCYEEEVIRGYHDEDLANMFIVDGCAVVHFMSQITKPDSCLQLLKELKIRNEFYVDFIVHDLLLLENQLPYEVLEILASKSKPGESLSLTEFMDRFISNKCNVLLCERENQKRPGAETNPDHLKQNQPGAETNPDHLLNLLRRRLLSSVDDKPKLGCGSGLFQSLVQFMDKICKCLPLKRKQYIYILGNVEELKAWGIWLRKSDTRHIRDVSFKRGTLKLPPLVMNDSTVSMLLNLAAYEMCPDFLNEFGVSSYLCFLYELIRRPQDVKELRERHILKNSLRSDEELATLIYEISKDLVQNPEMYSKVKSDIMGHSNWIWRVWIAEFFQTHCKSPLTVFAFIVGMVVLVSTVLQAIYTLKGYYKIDPISP